MDQCVDQTTVNLLIGLLPFDVIDQPFSPMLRVRVNIRTHRLFPHKLELCWRRFSTRRVADAVVNKWIISSWATCLHGVGWRPMFGITQETPLFTFPEN